MATFTGEGLACIRGERRVFDGLDFKVQSGGALVLAGPNGSGKTSLLRLMAGLGVLADGSLRWNGAAIHDNPEAHHARLCFVGHADAIKASLSVRENLTFWAVLHGTAERVDGALDHFGLGHLAGTPARFLSAGQRRRLTLARLLATKAPLWLLDEPEAALDHEAAARLREAIARHRAQGGMVVLATHGEETPPEGEILELAFTAWRQERIA
ncbi:MAG: heme ABC exporter ATP-binding protein CcmA [Alphaproteobacteria bacterium]|nr:heme ABC exporter ATP-binding protein CcmA [Alphaproteobacteria bacterium]